MLLAFDKSARSYDTSGRLHLKVTNISKAAINPYLGREIPNHKALGLDSDKVYRMFRDPVELEKAAPTFNNLPLLSKHVPHYAKDHQPELVVGCTGSDANFIGPYLQTSLVIWAQDSINNVENETQKELSSSYEYTALMEPGAYAGEMYDGKMTNIIGNHVALVEVGRAGPDVVVSDSNPFGVKPMKFTKKTFDTKVKPLLAQDSALTFESFIALSKIGAHVVKPCLAADAKIEDAELSALVTSASEAEVAQDALTAFGNLSAEEKAAIKAKFFAADEDPAIKPKVAEDGDDEEDELKAEKVKTAMDAAIATASKAAKATAMKDFKELRTAEKAVAPLVGEVAAMDSADEVYKFALDSIGVDTKDVHPSAYPALVNMAIQSKSGSQAQNSTMAQDAANASTEFRAMFPDAVIPARAF